MWRGRVTHIRSLGGTRCALRWRRRGRRAMHGPNFRFMIIFSPCSVEQKSQRLLCGGPREKCSPAKVSVVLSSSFSREFFFLLLEGKDEPDRDWISDHRRQQGGRRTLLSSWAVRQQTVRAPPARLAGPEDPVVRASADSSAAAPAWCTRARRVRCLLCPTELRHRSRSPGGSLVPPPPGCKRSS